MQPFLNLIFVSLLLLFLIRSSQFSDLILILIVPLFNLKPEEPIIQQEVTNQAKLNQKHFESLDVALKP